MKKKLTAVGAGGRLCTFTFRLVEEYQDQVELIAICDNSKVRMETHNDELVKRGYHRVPCYSDSEFERMLHEHRPDYLLVTTVDSTHHTYILKALEQGVKVITEKPMTTTAESCQAILDKVKDTGVSCRVAFNYRFINSHTKVKELISENTIGKVLSVNLEYLLDTNHGADYFRRWHSSMQSSGGLLVHKSTHHFDLVNWWLDAIPEQVFAYGKLSFYGKANAIKRGDGHLTQYPRYTGFTTKKDDPFALSLKDGDRLEKRYYNAEAETGYIRDKNVFRDGIDIYDNMSVNVRYRNQVILNYSLNAYSPREGMRVTFNGERGRIEYYDFGGSHIIKGQGDEEFAAEQAKDPEIKRITVYPHFKRSYEVPIEPSPVGGHGGSDILLAKQIFSHNPPPEHLGRNAGHEQGAASILIGIAANQSIEKNVPVNIKDLVDLAPQATRLSQLI